MSAWSIRARSVAAVIVASASLGASGHPTVSASQATNARAAIRGVVTAREDGRPLESVQVYLVGARMGALSGADGRYEIGGIPAGTYELRAERIGLDLGRRMITVADEPALEVQFQLGVQPVPLQEVRSDGLPGRPATLGSPARGFAPPRRPASGPVFTPFSVRPSLLNSEQVQDAMANLYTPEVIARGVKGTATVWLYVAIDGVVESVDVKSITDHGNAAFEPILEEMVSRVTPFMRFSPAYNRDQATAVWVSLPLTFTPGLPGL